MAAKRRSPGKRKERVSLDRERILAAADAVISRDGLPTFSMRSLGAELGVEAMSLYHHFRSKAHLLDALLDQIIGTIAFPDSSRPWRERMTQSALAYRAALLSRPAFAVFVLTHRMNTPSGLRLIEGMLQLFIDGGFRGERLARTFRSFGYYLTGALLEEAAGYARGPGAADPPILDAQRAIAPNLISIGRYFTNAEHERTFRYGLDLLLDALER